MVAELVPFNESLPAWQKAFYAFLAEKEWRSGFGRSVDAYSRTLQRFFGALGKRPDSITSPEVFTFAHGIGPSGREPARIACIASFYRFLIRMGMVAANPCDQIGREGLAISRSLRLRSAPAPSQCLAA